MRKMFCVRCGCKIEEDDDIIGCPECGAIAGPELEQSVQREIPEKPIPLVNPWQQATPQQQVQQNTWQQVTPQQQVQQNTWQQPIPQTEVVMPMRQAQEVPPVQPQWTPPHMNSGVATPPPKKKRGLIIAFVAVFVVALAVLGVTQASAFMTFARQTFMEPHEYYQYVEKKEASKLAGYFVSAYQKGVKETTQITDIKSQGEFSVRLGAAVTDMMAQGSGMDFSWLKNAGVAVDTNSKDNAYDITAQIKLNEQAIAAGNIMLDMQKERLYLQLPQLQQSWLAVDLQTLLEESGADIEQMEEVMAQTQKIYEALPEGAKLETLINKYSSLIISCITDVEKKKDILYADGVTAECTLLVATVDEDTVKDMCEAVFEAILDDEQLEDLVLEVMSLQEDMDAKEAYDEFLDSVSEALDYVDELEMDGEVELSLWINKKGAIYGRSIDVEIDDTSYCVSYAFPRDGAKMGMEIEVKTDMSSVTLAGCARLADGKISGEAQLEIGDGEIVNFALDNVKLSGGKGVEGTVIITLPAAVADSLSGQVPFDLKKAALQIDFVAKQQENSMAWSVLFAEELFASIEVSSKTGKAEAVELPSEDKCLLVEDEAAMEGYMEGMSYEQIIQNLKNAGVPEDLLNNIPLE